MDPGNKIVFKKAHWTGHGRPQWAFYCPNCSVERRVPYRPRPGNATHFFQMALVTAMLTLATWNLFGLKGVVWFIPVWITFETAS